MGNSMKTPTNTEVPSNTEVTETTDTPSSNTNLLLSSCILNPLPPLLTTDEMSVHYKKWQDKKAEQDKKDEMYKNVPLTKEFLQQNIDKDSWIEFNPSLSSLLTKDIYGFDILKINLVDYGLKYSKYISSVKINFVSKSFDDEVINAILRNSKYNLTFDTYNLIFYGDFVQNQNLLLSNKLSNYIVLPQFITNTYDNVDINILNIKSLLPILEELEIKILVSTLEFNEFAEGRIHYNHCFEQDYDRNDGTWNKLNIANCSGCTCVGYSMNVPTKTVDDMTR
jgi:hypothetical protein